MEKIGTILQNTIKRSRLEKRLTEVRIFVDYDEIVGDKISRISKPTFIQNNTLFIGVKNHIWLHQLYFLKSEIISKINSNLKRNFIKDIKFSVRDIKVEEEPKKSTKSEQIKNIELPEKTVNKISNICENIIDGDLKKCFEQFMLKDAKYKMREREKIVYPHRQ